MNGPHVTIVKGSGERVPFDVQKVELSCRRSGASPELAAAAAAFAATGVREGMTTAEIRALVDAFLNREHPVVAARYSLKEAMRRLGPEGFEFERFVAKVLQDHGYAAELPELLSGMCVQHEVDVIARKDGVTAMIECKYRNGPGIYARLKDVMATWARYDDLREAHAAGKCPVAFTEAWIACNTKVTSDGIAFAECKGMRCLAWRYPANGGLEQLIESTKSYPITILRSVDERIEQQLVAAGFILCRDIASIDVDTLIRQTGCARPLAIRLHAEASALVA